MLKNVDKLDLKEVYKDYTRLGLVHPDSYGGVSQNGIRWTSDVIAFVTDDANVTWPLFLGMVRCKTHEGWYERFPGSGEPCSIDDYIAFALSVCRSGFGKFCAGDILENARKRWGFMGPREWRHNIYRFPALISALRKAAHKDFFLDRWVVQAALRLAQYQLKKNPWNPDGWALSYYLAVMFDVKWFKKLFKKQYPLGYGQLLRDWGGKWPKHPTTMILINREILKTGEQDAEKTDNSKNGI